MDFPTHDALVRHLKKRAFRPEWRHKQPESSSKLFQTPATLFRGQPGSDLVQTVQGTGWRQGIPRSHLEELGDAAKAALFGHYLPVPAAKAQQAAGLLRDLAALSPPTARRFELKKGSREHLTFRLLFRKPRGKGGNGSSNGATLPRAYYALSYRWQSTPRFENYLKCAEKWTAATSAEAFIETPTSQAMFEAIMEELPVDDVGLWCDQICIDEANGEERGHTIGMMDIVYRAAEKVIVALDDIEIEDHELQAMIEFGAWHDYHTTRDKVPEDVDLKYLSSRPHLRSCAEKVMYSEYFDRAWCGHEFELAQDRLVLVRVRQTRPDEVQRVLRISNEKLHTLVLLLTIENRPDISPEQAGRRVNVELLIARSDRDNLSARSRMVHDMQTLALILSMAAGGDPTLPAETRPYSAIKDKLSIFLNACDLNLVPARSLDFTQLPFTVAQSRAHQDVSLLMLAAGNPLVLTTTGPPVLISNQRESWLRTFWLLDAGIDLDLRPLRQPLPIQLDQSPDCRFVKLDLLMPAAGGLLRTASEKCLLHARKFVQNYSSRNIATTQVDAETAAARQDYMANLIACKLECRTDSANKSFSRINKGPRFEDNALWQYFFRENLDAMPDAMSYARDGHGNKTALQLATQLMSNLLLAVPSPEARGDAMAFRPLWFELGSIGIRNIVVAPKDEGVYYVALPKVLKSRPYTNLSRWWILDKSSDENWTVRNRSRLCFEELDKQDVEPDTHPDVWETKTGQVIWGRTRTATPSAGPVDTGVPTMDIQALTIF